MTDKRGGVRVVRLMYCCNVVINRDPPRISTSLANLCWEVVGRMVQRRSSWWCHRTVGWYRVSGRSRDSRNKVRKWKGVYYNG